jgi:hypothetical protein
MLRLISGVILGYLVFALSALALFRLTNHPPHEPASIAFMAVSVVYGILFAVLAGWVAAGIAGRRDLLAAKIVAVILALGAVVSMNSITNTGFPWTQVSALFLMAPAVVLGGMLNLRRKASAR